MSLKITRSSEQSLGIALVDAADHSSTLEVKKKKIMRALATESAPGYLH